MKNKSLQLLKKQLQNIPAGNRQVDLGPVLIQLCREIVNFFEIDICSVLIPESNTFLKKILLKVSSQQETVSSYIFIPPDNLAWQWKPGRKKSINKQDIISLPDMEEGHPYKDPTQFFLQCTIRAMVIVPLCLNNEVLGYILLINEKTPRSFTNEEINLLKESAAYFITAIKKAISHEEEALTAKMMAKIDDYKRFLQDGNKQDPMMVIKIFQDSGIPVRRVLLVNKDHHLGNMWYNAVINAAGAVEVNEMGTIAESGFEFFIKDLVIEDPQSICVPIRKGNNKKGKLAIKYSQIEKDGAVIGNMLRVLEAIAPQLAELMYL